MALDIDTDAIRQASEFVANAGAFLHPDLDSDVPACGSDEVSQTVMNNLNARRRWLLEHVRSGASQAASAATGINDTAASLEAQDAAGAAGYGGGTAAAPVSVSSASAVGAPAPTGMPAVSAIPDISGSDGETLAAQLEVGAGAGPALAAATQLGALSARALAANHSLTAAQGQIIAAGQSQAHPGLMSRLNRAIGWSAGVAGHAEALAAGYGSAGQLHTTTMTAVGPSAGWRILKTSYADAVMENQMTGGLSQPKVDALQTALTNKEVDKGTAMSGYQAGGEVVSIPPGDLPDPGLDPNADSGSAEKADKADKAAKALGTEPEQAAAGMQDMLGPLMGALGPLTQSLGKANPLSSLGQAAQQLGKLGGDAAKNTASPLKPAALAKPSGLGAKGSGGKGGGGSPIKPSNPLGGVRAASLSGSPPASAPAGESIKPTGAVPARSSGIGAGGGMGMMPMGQRPGGGDKAEKVRSYESSPTEIPEAGRAEVEAKVAAQPAPTVDPESQNAVKERLARRKRNAAADSSG